MLMQNLRGQTKSIMVFSDSANCSLMGHHTTILPISSSSHAMLLVFGPKSCKLRGCIFSLTTRNNSLLRDRED